MPDHCAATTYPGGRLHTTTTTDLGDTNTAPGAGREISTLWDVYLLFMEQTRFGIRVSLVPIDAAPTPTPLPVNLPRRWYPLVGACGAIQIYSADTRRFDGCRRTATYGLNVEVG